MKKRCLGCLVLYDGIGRSGRCPACLQAQRRKYDSSPERRAAKRARYDADYRRQREQWAFRVAVFGFRCARGGEEHPAGAEFDLDHIDGALRPSCAFHNRGRTDPVPQ